MKRFRRVKSILKQKEIKSRRIKNMKQSKEHLIDELIPIIKKAKTDNRLMKKVTTNLQEFNLNSGQINKILNNLETELMKMDLRLLCVITNEFYFRTGNLSVKTDDYFTEKEIKRSQLFDMKELEKEEEIKFPITLPNVTMIDDENFVTTLDIKFISKLYNNGILEYNPDTQRESSYVRRRNQIIEKPKIYPLAVKEITDKLLADDLETTTITLNALVGTSDSGDEIHYDPKKMELTFNEGTEIDILDGFHRLTASRNALEINPGIDHHFIISIKNFNTAAAQKHFAEISKINAVNKVHIQQLEQSKKSDVVVKHLQRNSDLKGRISKTGQLHRLNDEIVSYNVLSDTIDEVFEIKNKHQAIEVGDYLVDFFDYLLGVYHDEFNDNYDEVNKTSLLNTNLMFAGYIVLAKRLKDEELPIKYVKNVIKSIDFRRENDLWKELGILDHEKNIKQRARVLLKKYFEEINLLSIQH